MPDPGLADAEAGRHVSVITVSFNSGDVLPEMLRSIAPTAEIIVVDNASRDGDGIARISAEFGAITLRNDRNRGFGAACNQGAARATREFLLFLNPDATLQPGALAALWQAQRRWPAASAFNPRIERRDGRQFFLRKSCLLPRSRWLPRELPGDDREVPVLSGAAIFMRRDLFAEAGGFDEAIFLYHEDDDLSRRLAVGAGPLMYIHAAVVRHLVGASSGTSLAVTRLKYRHMGYSRVYAMRKHRRPWARSRNLAIALAYALSSAVMWPRYRRAKRIAYLQGVWAGITDTGPPRP